MSPRTIPVLARIAAAFACLLATTSARAATLEWKGHTWQVTAGGMAGVCEGDPANVSIDADGYLHLEIRKSGSSWTAAELFTTDRLGFGTYQWHIDGPIDVYDKNVVLGLFPYGPADGIGDDGTNEIDIEYSRWGVANGPNGDFTNYPASGTTVGELSYTFSLGGSTLSTSRFTWTTASITSAVLAGLVAVDAADAPLKSFAYAPANSLQNIPQQALPLGMNLWCFDAPPSDGQPVAIVIRDFTFIPEGMSGAGAGGSGGRSASGGSAGKGSAGVGGSGGKGDAGLGGSDEAGAPPGGSSGMANAGTSGRTGTSGAPSGASGGRGGAAGANHGVSGTNSTAGAGNTSGGTGGAGDAGRAGVMEPTGTSGSPSSGGAASGDARGCGCSLPKTDDRTGAAIAALIITAAVLKRCRARVVSPFQGPPRSPRGTG